MSLPESIHLEIVTPEQRLVNEVVDEVVLPGSEGSLGVLPGHTPLLTTLGIGELMYRRGTARRFLAIAWGFAEVLPDRVSVLAEIAERAEGIDRERALKARDRAGTADLDLWRRRFAIGSTDDADAIMRRCAEDAAALPRCPRCGDDEDGGRMVNDKCNVCGHRQQDEDDENEIAEPDIERKIHEA